MWIIGKHPDCTLVYHVLLGWLFNQSRYNNSVCGAMVRIHGPLPPWTCQRPGQTTRTRSKLPDGRLCKHCLASNSTSRSCKLSISIVWRRRILICAFASSFTLLLSWRTFTRLLAKLGTQSWLPQLIRTWKISIMTCHSDNRDSNHCIHSLCFIHSYIIYCYRTNYHLANSFLLSSLLVRIPSIDQTLKCQIDSAKNWQALAPMNTISQYNVHCGKSRMDCWVDVTPWRVFGFLFYKRFTLRFVRCAWFAEVHGWFESVE